MFFSETDSLGRIYYLVNPPSVRTAVGGQKACNNVGVVEGRVIPPSIPLDCGPPYIRRKMWNELNLLVFLLIRGPKVNTLPKETEAGRSELTSQTKPYKTESKPFV